MEISLIVTIAPLLAGLGLFFSGVHLISANLTLLPQLLAQVKLFEADSPQSDGIAAILLRLGNR
jgi:hypothetical protein